MAYLRHLTRFCFAATLLVAAMLLAPSGAYAHTGHDHGPAKVQSSILTPHHIGMIVIQQQLKGGPDSVTEQSKLLLSAASTSPAGKAKTTCTGGCCHSAGHGCCAAALLTSLTLGQPTG